MLADRAHVVGPMPTREGDPSPTDAGGPYLPGFVDAVLSDGVWLAGEDLAGKLFAKVRRLRIMQASIYG